MAILQTVSSAVPASGTPQPGVLHVAPWTYEFAVNPTAADVVECCVLPPGAVVVGGFIYAVDLDTGTEALDMDLGWAANGGTLTHDAVDADGLGNFGVWNGDAFALGNLWNVAGQCWILAGILATGVFPKFSKRTKVQLTVNVTANATGTGKLAGVVHYYIDPTIIA